jgi:hypothetical protein
MDQQQLLNMDLIQQIENAPKDPKALSPKGAMGLYQIMPIVVEDWNQMHPNEQLTNDQMFDPDMNTKVALWYAHQRIPQLLTSFGHPLTTDNALVAYNAGISHVGEEKLPLETANYLTKYNGLLGAVPPPIAPTLALPPAPIKVKTGRVTPMLSPFEQAFADASKKGLPQFTFEGKKFTTEKK